MLLCVWQFSKMKLGSVCRTDRALSNSPTMRFNYEVQLWCPTMMSTPHSTNSFSLVRLPAKMPSKFSIFDNFPNDGSIFLMASKKTIKKLKAKKVSVRAGWAYVTPPHLVVKLKFKFDEWSTRKIVFDCFSKRKFWCQKLTPQIKPIPPVFFSSDFLNLTANSKYLQFYFSGRGLTCSVAHY